MNEIKMNAQSLTALKGAAKWAKFLAIVGFIGAGLMVFFAIFGAFGASVVAAMRPGPSPAGMGVFVFLVYMIGAVVAFFTSLFLYRFATGSEKALADGEENSLSGGVDNLRKYFKLQGIITIIGLAMIPIALIVVLVVGVSQAM